MRAVVLGHRPAQVGVESEADDGLREVVVIAREQPVDERASSAAMPNDSSRAGATYRSEAR